MKAAVCGFIHLCGRICVSLLLILADFFPGLRWWLCHLANPRALSPFPHLQDTLGYKFLFCSFTMCVFTSFSFQKKEVPEGGSLVAGIGEEHKQDETYSCHCILDLICSNARSWIYLTSCCVRVLSVSWKVWRTLYLLCLKHKRKRLFSLLKETPEQFVLYIRGKCLVSWSLPDSL